MLRDDDDLKHLIHQAPGVFYVLDRPLDESALVELSDRLKVRAENVTGRPQDHWNVLQDRMSGRLPWTSVVQRPRGPYSTPQQILDLQRTTHSVSNMLRLLPFAAYTIDGLDYVIDVFNPVNELELPYPTAGEPVVAILLRGDNQVIQRGLIGRNTFYEVLVDIDRVLAPRFVCGTHSMAAVAFAYKRGALDPITSPWSLLYQLTILWDDLIETDRAQLAKHFKVVRPWPKGRTLFQVQDGLDAELALEYVEAAELLHMTAAQQLIPGGYDPPPRRPKDTFRRRS